MVEPGLVYADGALVLVHASSTVRVPEDEIVCLVAPVSPGGHYTLAWLHEKGDDKDASAVPFSFATTALSEADVQQLPPAVRARHLIAGEGPPWLAAAARPTLHVVVSIRSGLGRAQVFYDAVLQPLLAVVGGVAAVDGTPAPPYNVLVTSSSRSVGTFARRLVAERTQQTQADGAGQGAATVILLSGDGGVVDLLNGVTEGNEAEAEADAAPLPTIAVLPLGTGNALFHSIHRPAYVAAAGKATAPSSLMLGLRTLLRGRPKALPDFVASFSPGAHTVRYAVQDEAAAESGSPDTEARPLLLQEGGEPVARLRGAIVASYGFHAQLVWESDTPAYRQHGDKRFGMAAGELLKLSHAYVADVSFTATETAAKTVLPRHKFHYVLATLVSNLEKTFTISPASRPLDGQLRLVHFGAVGAARTMEVMAAAYRDGAHVGMQWPAGDDGSGIERVGYDAIGELEVHTLEEDARWRKVCIDGTIVEIPKGGWMKVRRASKPALRVLAVP